jgi:hypothetical protein
MYHGKHFLNHLDLKFLMGTNNMPTVYRRYKAICQAIKPGKHSLTIKEFCQFEGYDFEEMWGILRPGVAYP